jgi:hypothetical protein
MLKKKVHVRAKELVLILVGNCKELSIIWGWIVRFAD